MIVGGLAAVMILLVFTSTIPGKLPIAIGLIIVAIALLVRLDTEPNYVYLLHIMRHFAYRRRFERTFDDATLKRMQTENKDKVAFEKLFQEEEKEESADERKERRKAERAERKAEDKILKSRKATEAEKDAIYLKRAQRNSAKKRSNSAKKASNASAYDMENIVAFTGIANNLIEYAGEYFGAAIEIPPVEFRFMSEMRRANSIENGLGSVLRVLPPEYAANIVKIERPVSYDRYLDNEYDKLDSLRLSYEKGLLTEEELKSRVEVLYDRINDLRNLCYNEKVMLPFYYVVLFNSDRQQLENMVQSAIGNLQRGEMNPHRLDTKELAVFLKYTNQVDFDERDIDQIDPAHYALWAMPEQVHMKGRTVVVNQIITHNMRIANYPSIVNDAWLASVLSLPATKVVIKCTPMDRGKSIRAIDRSMQELRSQYMNTGVDSRRLELQEHIQTLANLLSMLQGDNETLLELNVYVTAYDIHATRADDSMIQPPPSCLASIANMKRLVRRTYQEQGMTLNNMEFDQVNAFIASQVSALDPMCGKGRGVPSNSIAAAYPWVFASVSDEKGVKLGSSDGVPVFVDFFRRDSERVNSNMVIVGKSGSGKSYATKSILTNLAADGAKIFVIDPENEYTELAENLKGKFINVGNAKFGRLNPFHIITALEDDEANGSTVSGSYATHLQFLEEFFRQILPDCEKDAMEYLNSMIDRMYTNMGITAETDLSKLRPEDYPVFDDLYDAVLAEFQSTDNEYIRSMLRTLMNYVAKFSNGGRNANIWNGPSSVTTAENFTVFNFQSLLANRNSSIANAQMLLVLKYIDNEIIKNRDYNTKYGLNRKIVVVIDEAHVFIDTKYPAALDFMYQLAKRIRKYNGMQIVITQNIKDFVGSEEIARKSTAIINACQYSFIFPLSPNDMGDLCTLYEKAGGINGIEQEQIINAPRGQAFAIMSPQSRSTFQINVPKDMVAMFKEQKYQSNYFAYAEGEANWREFLGDSKEKHDMLRVEADIVEQIIQEEKERNTVLFEEISEEEFAAEMESKEEQKAVAFEEEIPEFDVDEGTHPAYAETLSVNPTAAPVEAPSAIPQVIVQAPASSSETERILSELLKQFSYDSMREEIRRSLREEMKMERPAQEKVEIAPQPEEDSVALGSIFNEDAMAEAQRLAEETFTVEESEPIDEPDEGTDTDSEASFDIMAMLLAEAEQMKDISAIEMMETYDEKTIEISLQDLSSYLVKNK
ncbi:MAG: ATP-binding protein [Clostridiales bacterium]|nr:ATP-binding protein [Candidatus Cacconaster stercorequi]